MAYNRQPNVVLAGVALKQNPPSSTLNPAGILPVTIDAEIATSNTLGVIQVGSGLNITANGVLSTTVAPGGVSVKLVSNNYTILSADYYIGATKHPLTLTLPLGTLGKFYIIKNQSGGGNVTVVGTSGQTLDTSNFKNLGNEASLMVIFDGTRWNIVQ
jgi:hypothetical protein